MLTLSYFDDNGFFIKNDTHLINLKYCSPSHLPPNCTQIVYTPTENNIARFVNGEWIEYPNKLGNFFYDRFGNAKVISYKNFILPDNHTYTPPPLPFAIFQPYLINGEWHTCKIIKSDSGHIEYAFKHESQYEIFLFLSGELLDDNEFIKSELIKRSSVVRVNENNDYFFYLSTKDKSITGESSYNYLIDHYILNQLEFTSNNSYALIIIEKGTKDLLTTFGCLSRFEITTKQKVNCELFQDI